MPSDVEVSAAVPAAVPDLSGRQAVVTGVEPQLGAEHPGSLP